MFEWFKIKLGLNLIEEHQITINLRLEEICCRLDQIEEKLTDYNFDKIPDAIENLEDNIKRVNQMTLELKGIVSQSRAAINISRNKQPRQ